MSDFTADELEEIGVEIHPYTDDRFCCVDLVAHHFDKVPATRLVSVAGTWSGPAACDDDDHLDVAILAALFRFSHGDGSSPIEEVLG
jgi:hypothetical protein